MLADMSFNGYYCELKLWLWKPDYESKEVNERDLHQNERENDPRSTDVY